MTARKQNNKIPSLDVDRKRYSRAHLRQTSGADLQNKSPHAACVYSTRSCIL